MNAVFNLASVVGRLIPFSIKATKDTDHPGLGVSALLIFGPRVVSVHVGWGR